MAAKKPIVVTTLPDYKGAQVSEAMMEEHSFKMRDGAVFTFQPMEKWSMRTEAALNRGNIEAWAEGALKDPVYEVDGKEKSRASELLDQPGRDMARIVQFYADLQGVTPGEDGSSSTS